MDGHGSPAVRSDVIINGDKITDIGNFPDADATISIDAGGQAVAPGFIDAHTHLDFFLPSPRHAEVLKIAGTNPFITSIRVYEIMTH